MVSPAELYEELERVAASSICGRRSAEANGQTAIAVPVWTAGDMVACAIGVSAPTYIVDDGLEELMRSALVTAARALSEELGAAAIPPVAQQIHWGTTR